MSLRSSLILSIIFVVLVTLVFGAAISYLRALSKVHEEMQAAIAVGSRIAANAVDDVDEARNPSRRLKLLVADFDGDRHLRAAWLDKIGRIVSVSNPLPPTLAVPDWFQSLIRKPERRVRVRLPEAFEPLGSFVLITDSRNEIAEVWDDSWNTLTILFVFCGLVLGILYLMLGRALRPLDRLAAAFAEIGSSEKPPQISERGPIELVRVYRGFNRMAERLSRSEAHNRRLNDQLANVQEEERADIARDLHDEIGPFLFSVDVDASSIATLVADGDVDEIPPRVVKIRESIGHMQRHVKDLLGRLRAASLLDVGLADAIDNLVSFWRERYPEITFTVDAPDEPRSKVVDGTLFRVVQEAMSNAVRHGHPQNISVRVANVAGKTSLSICDDGRGLKSGDVGTGYGIPGMKERIGALNGQIEIKNRRGVRGVEVSAWIPPTNVPPNRRQPMSQTEDKHTIHDQA